MPHKEVEGYPSVTEILGVIRKPALERWYGIHGLRKCEEISEKAKSFGTRVHEEIQRLLEGYKPKSKNKTIREMVDTFNEKFIKEYQVRPVVVEPKEPLIDPENKYSGTFDAVITTNNGKVPILADWKTSNYIDETSWLLQVSAYANLWNKHSLDKPIESAVIVRLNKKNFGKLDVLWYPELQPAFEVFLSCKKLYDYIKR